MTSNSHYLFLALLCVGLVPLASPLPGNKYHKTLVDYIVSLVKYLASQQAGTFDCWLYHACSDPPGSSALLQQIHRGLNYESVPVLSTSSSFNWSLVMHRTKTPSLVVIHFDYTSRNLSVWGNYGRLTGTVNSDTKILFLFGTRPIVINIPVLLKFFLSSKMYNVFFLSTDQEEGIVPYFLQDRAEKFDKFLNPKMVFPDQSRNHYGQPLRYSLVKGIMNTCIGGECFGYDVTLVKEMARYLNTTAQYVKFVCPYELDEDVDYLFDCVRDVAYSPDCIFDIFAEPSAGSECDRAFLELPKPFENVFLAPCGRSLSIVELFLRPFRAELWIVIFVAMVLIKMTSLLMPYRFTNDPLLLPICGFERFGLNQAERKEKLVMITLILVFFFITNAYETKIISLMSSKPRVRLISTLQDVLDTGTTVKADRLLALDFPMFSSLYSYVNHTHEPEEQLDGTSVYMTNGFVGSLLVQRAINWDYGSNQPRYRIMDERFAMGVAFYPMPVKSALKHHFRFVQKALFETGVMNHWWEMFVKLSNGKRSVIRLGGVNPVAGILKFADMVPIWYIMLFGFLISLFVLSVEIYCAYMFGVNRI